MSSTRRGLPEAHKMRHDKHFVDELTNQATIGVGILLPVDQIESNREQPRSAIGDLGDLVASIRRHGVLEPLLVRRLPNSRQYQLIAGERRFHAAIEAGLSEVPCIEMSVSDQQALELALIENLQRKDLTPFEEAEGFRVLAEKYGYSHEAIADAVGKSRSSVTETLRLLAIPPAIRDLCRHADIHAKSLLLLIARARSIEDMELLVSEITEKSLDREAARLLARAGHDNGEAAASLAATEAEQGVGGQRAPGADGGFRPIRIKYREAPDAPVHLSISVRRPGVSREDIVRTLEALLEQVRGGSFDDHLRKAADPTGDTGDQ